MMEKFFMERRKWAKLFFTFLVFLCAFSPLGENSAQIKDRIQREAQEFRLEDVRLLDGPFKNAMMRDAAYLLRLDPDRLLSGYAASRIIAFLNGPSSSRTSSSRN